MREFKFRVYDEEQEEMQYNLLDSYLNVYSHSICAYENYPLMQYTGVMDKDGVEIYEGDVVLVEDLGFPYVDLKYKVEYNNELAQFVCNGIDNNNWNVPFKDLGRVEVIGNIYEDVFEQGE